MAKRRHTTRGRFRVATINALGHSHTTPGSDKAKRGWLGSYARTLLLLIIIRVRRLDVVGLQEFQPEQRRVFVKRMGKRWGIAPEGDNAVVWRRDVWRLVGNPGHFTVPYFHGKPKRMPYVVLEHLQSGKLVAFASTHNPASVRGEAGLWRRQGWDVEAHWAGDMVAQDNIAAAIVVGDRNAPARTFMPYITKLGGIPSGVPGIDGERGIDWIVGWGDVEFSHHRASMTTRIGRATDHPVTQAVGTI